MMRSELARQLAELTKRVERLEGKASPGASTTTPTRPLTTDQPHVTYSGTGPWGGGNVVWQIIRVWGDVLTETGERSASVFNALANPARLRIVTELMTGDGVTTAELGRRLDQPSSGQLFHHLKELLAAGVIHQPVRGTYAIRGEHAVPLLAMFCAALDIRYSHLTESRHDDEPG